MEWKKVHFGQKVKANNIDKIIISDVTVLTFSFKFSKNDLLLHVSYQNWVMIILKTIKIGTKLQVIGQLIHGVVAAARM